MSIRLASGRGRLIGTQHAPLEASLQEIDLNISKYIPYPRYGALVRVPVRVPKKPPIEDPPIEDPPIKDPPNENFTVEQQLGITCFMNRAGYIRVLHQDHLNAPYGTDEIKEESEKTSVPSEDYKEMCNKALFDLLYPHDSSAMKTGSDVNGNISVEISQQKIARLESSEDSFQACAWMYKNILTFRDFKDNSEFYIMFTEQEVPGFEEGVPTMFTNLRKAPIELRFAIVMASFFNIRVKQWNGDESNHVASQNGVDKFFFTRYSRI